MDQDRLIASLLAAVPHPMLVVGDDARIAWLNAPARAILGDADGRHYLTVIRQPEPVALLERVLAGGEGGTTRWRLTGPGRDTVYRGLVARVAGLGASLAFQDVSDVEHAADMRRDFVANVSHELRTPLTALLGFIETLRGAARDDPAARARFLGIMEREALRMNRLVGDLLSLSRVEAEERVRPRTQVELAGLARSVLATLRGMADAAQVTLTLDAEADLPPVAGDLDQLTQVLHNLVENAVKYGGSGKTVRVVLRRVAHDPVLRSPGLSLSVIDQGAGIDAIHLPRLTERFYRVDTHRSREQGGTGLGLAIVKHIINRHRGRLKISSEKGKGSVFEVVLPLI
ncbi:MAG: ATP-binding protein [Gemmobacter sp.]|uniref:ATP-binding protein n=1 Tax=Gemmobacter sp. TaxID=1898957 RepID=UPI00391C4823